jgi:myosin heavy subunit
VIYETDGFLEKNRDLLHADLVELLGSCDCALTRQFSVSNGQGSQRANGSESQKQSVAAKFKVCTLKFCSFSSCRRHQIFNFVTSSTSSI